jgi:hypothetical protein
MVDVDSDERVTKDLLMCLCYYACGGSDGGVAARITLGRVNEKIGALKDDDDG